jgi:hypothetical protein
MKSAVIIFVSCVFLSLNGNAQSYRSEALKKPTVFERKFLVGFAVNNSWANYRDARDSSFYRPSLGTHARIEYRFMETMHLSLGAGIQQRGMGIYTPDLNNSVGNQDSTGRLRYRSTTLDFPIEVAFRPKKEVFKNTRMRFAIGATPSVMHKALRIWKSLDDGFHVEQVITPDFARFDIPLRASAGLDIKAPGNVLFRASFVFEYGFKSIYTSPINGTKSYTNSLFGLDLTFLF